MKNEEAPLPVSTMPEPEISCDVVLGPLIRCPVMRREERWKKNFVYFPFTLFGPFGRLCGVKHLEWKLSRVAQWIPGYACYVTTMAILVGVDHSRGHMANMHNAWKLRSGHVGADCQAEGLKAAWIAYANSFYVGTALAMTIAFALVMLGPSDFGSSGFLDDGNWLQEHLYEIYMFSNVVSCAVSAVGVHNTAAYLEVCALVPAAGYSEWMRLSVVDARRPKILAWQWYDCALSWLFLSLVCLVYGSSQSTNLAVAAWLVIVAVREASRRDSQMRSFSAWDAKTSPIRRASPEEYAAESVSLRAATGENIVAGAESLRPGTQLPGDFNVRILNKVQLGLQYLESFAKAEFDLGNLLFMDDAAALAVLGAPELGVGGVGHRCRILAQLRADAGYVQAGGAGLSRKPLRHKQVRHIL